MQIQRLVDLEDYEFDTLLVTYNHKNRLSIELGKVSEIFEVFRLTVLLAEARYTDFEERTSPIRASLTII